jgi:hypothetical protein
MADKDAHETLQRWLARAEADEGMSDEVLNKRDSARTTWSAHIIILGGSGEKIHGRIRDVTEDGLGIHCRSKINEYSEVRVQLEDDPDEHIDGVVVHCTQTVGAFKIGVRLK